MRLRLAPSAGLRAAAGQAVALLGTPRELRSYCLLRMSRALEAHMRSELFLRCMRQGLELWSVACRATPPRADRRNV